MFQRDVNMTSQKSKDYASPEVLADKKIRKTLLVDFDYGRFRIAFLVIFLLHDITEASFKAEGFLWLIFLLVAMDMSSISQYLNSKKESRL